MHDEGVLLDQLSPITHVKGRRHCESKVVARHESASQPAPHWYHPPWVVPILHMP
jgi:hypothetical protein